MINQFRISLQHLKLYKMEPSFETLCNIFMLMIYIFFKLATLDYNISGGYTIKCWSLNIMDFKLALAPKNISSLRWTTRKSVHFKSLKCVS